MLARVFLLNTFIKVSSAVIALLSIPFLIQALGVENYGLWVTLSSIIGWLTIFDFGVGHALKNTVANTLATGAYIDAQQEAQQVFKFTSLIAILFSFIFVLLTYYVPFLKENKTLVLSLYLPIFLFFPLSMGAMILQGARKTHIQSAVALLLPVSVLFFALTCVYFEIQLELKYFIVYFCLFFVLVWFIYWYLAFKEIKADKKFYVDALHSTLLNKRLGVGGRFLILQLSSVVLYSSGNYLVYNYIDAGAAAEYDTVNKLYFFGLSIFNMAVAIFWPEISYSAANNNFSRVKNIYLIMLGLTIVFTIGAIGVSFFADDIIKVWTKDKIVVDSHTPFYFAYLVVVQAWAYSGAVVLNAVEKITGQLIISLASSVFLIPVFFMLLNHGYGIAAAPIAAASLSLIAMIYCNFHAVIYINKNLSIYSNVD